MELGTGFMGLPMPTMRNFNSKAEAIQFAIEFTASSSMGGRKVELEAAKELYDFICKNVVKLRKLNYNETIHKLCQTAQNYI